MKTIKKVDLQGNTIKNFSIWRKKHLSDIFFDSEFERLCYLEIAKSGLDFEFHPEKRVLQESFKTTALSKSKIPKLFKSTVRPISYTCDYKIKTDQGIDVYVEAKGYFTQEARLRYKLFQASLLTNEIVLMVEDKYYKKKSFDRTKDMKIALKLIKELYCNNSFKVKNKNKLDI